MKTTFALALLPLLALASPVPEPEQGAAQIEKRAVTCALTGSNVRYRQKPSTSATADGQFGAAGTKVSFSCYTSGTSVNGDPWWNKIASGTGKGDWVSDYYISAACSAQIPPC